MMILIVFLTVVLIIDCLFLMLLVLVQLPKKEAGMGQAFGGAATDALFGAGSGNALTKMTKYATAIFFVLTLTISILFAQHAKSRGGSLERELQRANATPDAPVPGKTPAAADAGKPVPNDAKAAAPAGNNVAGAPDTAKPAPGLLLNNVATNAPAASATNK
ncbi:MAG TPA: preprotein translocase subunit SecG [Candidatus Saccharimonadales bacterium]|nr:preprotein translocase subunit SecG [Candidatus Saccharimonadales bacterium]